MLGCAIMGETGPAVKGAAYCWSGTAVPGIAGTVAREYSLPMATLRMPALFVGHGNPMNAIEDSEFSRAWAEVAAALPRPRAILCVSAHWETRGVMVTAMEKPRTIHDFSGFPQELSAMQYPAPGSREVAEAVRAAVRLAPVSPDTQWGLDHGAWSVLCRMYPKADIPVLQLSLDRSQPMDFHLSLGRELAGLRDEGILVMGSGNIVHNLRMVDWSQAGGFDWAVDFDARAAELISKGDTAPLVDYARLGRAAELAINSAEHYKPLLYVLGARGADEPASFFAEGLQLGSLSMRGVRVG
jgi:4,5-DOPA dioxygenase extradiol